MARKIIFFIFLLFCFIIINSKACFCAGNPTLTEEQCQAIFDFITNTTKLADQSLKKSVKSSTSLAFMNYFNSTVAPKLYDATNGECDSSSHLTVVVNGSGVYFYVTNATLSNNLGFISISPDTSYNSRTYKVHAQYYLYITFSGNNSFSSSQVWTNVSQNIGLFYSGDTVVREPSFDKNMTTLLTPNLFYLGSKATSDVSFKPFGGDTFSWYFLEHCYIIPPSDVPSGDTPSGDTPSGDTPSGDTPDYNDKLDNISGLITNTNSKLDGISGEIGQTNNKLDGISGELGKINDNLTNVPDLSGTTINSGDIESALNFDFAEDPYSNFWLELTTGLSSALTSNNRSISVDFRNKTYNINLDDFALQVPDFLKSFLAIISTTFVVWQIVKYIKVIIDKISTGDMDYVLAMNEEERNC